MGVCEGEGDENARPRARAGAGGIQGILATTAEGCHHILVFHRTRRYGTRVNSLQIPSSHNTASG